VGSTQDEQRGAQTAIAFTRAWKYSQLFRPGLAPRALFDTGARAGVSIGVANYVLSGLQGANNMRKQIGLRDREPDAG